MPQTFWAAESSSGGLAGALGLDLRSLILNGLAFLVIVWLFGRYLYPPLTRALDAKRDELAAAGAAEAEAARRLEAAAQEAARITATARTEADRLLSEARSSADAVIRTATGKAESQAAGIVAAAHEELERDVARARADLRDETARLVARAAETVIGQKLDRPGDQALIAASLERTS